MLYTIIKENQNKIFWTIGQFEFEYFGGSDVVNKLDITTWGRGVSKMTQKNSDVFYGRPPWENIYRLT